MTGAVALTQSTLCVMSVCLTTWIKSCGTFLRLNKGSSVRVNISFNENEIYIGAGPPLPLHVRLGVGDGAVGQKVASAPAPVK